MNNSKLMLSALLLCGTCLTTIKANQIDNANLSSYHDAVTNIDSAVKNLTDFINSSPIPPSLTGLSGSSFKELMQQLKKVTVSIKNMDEEMASASPQRVNLLLEVSDAVKALGSAIQQLSEFLLTEMKTFSQNNLLTLKKGLKNLAQANIDLAEVSANLL